MDIYVTSKNTGPSWTLDPKHVLYIGTSLEEAESHIMTFARYERPFNPQAYYDEKLYSAIPENMDREMIKFYEADGWWCSIVKITLN